MAEIIKLDEKLANQIAAGEVIERPANVVKELVENSIDALATSIDIYIEDGGVALIKIVDNGQGMDKEDALKCFERHATSKIKSEYELFRLSTLGFRGEAIPSIASVSRFELKTARSGVGTIVIYEYGDLVESRDSDGKQGTTITITKLFHNLPARLKYLKSVNSEYAAILSYVERLALSHPEIAFSLVNNEKTVFKTFGNNDLLEVISCVYGLPVAKSMISVEGNTDEYYISGFVSKIDTSRSSKSNIITLMNGRVVRNQIAIDAINSVYRDYLPHDRYPIAIINIEVEPYLIDVNVHPAKLEVRLSKEKELIELIMCTVSAALKSTELTHRGYIEPVKKTDFSVQQQFYTDINENELNTDDNISIEVANNVKTMYVEKEQSFYIKEEQVAYSPVLKPMKEKLYVKGQVHGTYIICETVSKMVLIDQHAGQERINYEYFLNGFMTAKYPMMDLLVPVHIDLTKSEFEYVNERKEYFSYIGIEIEVFGAQSFVVKKLPVWMVDVDEQKYIDLMVEQVLNNRQIDIKELRSDAIATLACKASLKANMYLTLADMQTLVDNLMRCEQPYTCPHGRPTMIEYSSYDLEKIFKRVK